MLDIKKSGARYMHCKYTIETRCYTQPTWEQQKIQISLNMYTKRRAHKRKWEPNYTAVYLRVRACGTSHKLISS